MLLLYAWLCLWATPFLPHKAGKANSIIEVSFYFEKDQAILPKGEKLIVYFVIENKTIQNLSLQTYCSWYYQNKILHTSTRPAFISPQKTQTLKLTFAPTKQGFHKANFSVQHQGRWIKGIDIFFAHDLTLYATSPSLPPTDFKAFWEKTLDTLAAIPPQWKIERKPTLCTADYEVYAVEMQSWARERIRGWYRVPKNASASNKVPAILQLPSLAGSFYDVRSLEEKPKHGIPYQYAVLSLNIRGHGNSQDTYNAKKLGNEWLAVGVHSPFTYIYRGIIADCIRGIDFLASRPEVAQNQIIVEGGSQGGGLALIVAGLDSRVNLCCPDVPFLCHMTELSEVFWVKSALQKALNYKISWQQIQKNLAYFDAQFFAQKIKIPTYISIGLQDLTCPPNTAWQAFAQIPALNKEISIYPYGRHAGGGEEHRRAKFAWIATQLGIQK